MKIYRLNSEIYDIKPENNSTQRVVHMGENVLNLTFKTTEALDFRVNDYVIFEDEKYKFKKLVNPTRVSRHEFEYSCQLYSSQYDLQDALYVLEDSTGVGTLDDTIPLWGTALFHLQQIVKCAKVVHPEWSIGDVEQPSEGKNIVYSDMDCLQALQHLCTEFNIEYWITGTTISLGKKMHGQPLTFKYGLGNTLYDLRRENLDGRIITQLLSKGSDRNIDSATYGSKYLHLPNNEKFVSRNVEKFGVIQGRQSFIDVYPRLIHKNSTDPGAVTSVRVDEDGFYYIKDQYLDFIPEPLAGKNLVIDFQTGQLAGVKVDANWVPETSEYELITGDYGLGQDVPSSIFVPAPGDLYLLSDVIMPQAYIDAAERELKEKAEEAIAQICEQKVSYKGAVNPLYFRQLGERIQTGRAVVVEDNDIVDGGRVELRIQAYTKSVNGDTELDVEISDTLYVSRIERIESALQDVKLETEQRINYGDAYSVRRFQDALDTAEALQNAKLHFSEAINPITVQTMQMLIGDKQLQFVFVNSKTNPVRVDYLPTYNNDTKIFRCPAGIIQHKTLGITYLSSAHKASEYKYWDMPAFNSSPLVETSKKYYLYAKVSKSSTAGTFILTETSIEFEQVAGYYHLLSWIIDPEFDGKRSFVRMWGFSEFLPGQAFLDIISDPDRKTVFDLVNGKIIGNITITTGSSGYNNLSDKPDLGVYETKADFKVFSDSITASVNSIQGTVSGLVKDSADFKIFSTSISGTVTNISNTVNGLVTQSAGWITTATGNNLWASKTLENGETIVSKINQTASTITIDASKINLIGKVTFSMLNSSAQATINNKVDTTTIIEGGYIKTSLIKTDAIIANIAKIGNFTIENGWLKSTSAPGSNVGYIDMRYGSSRVAFGKDLMPATAGGAYTLTALIDNQNLASNYYGSTTALYLRAAGSSSVKSLALDAYGGVRFKGGSAFIEECAPLNTNISNSSFSSADNLKYYRNFAFQSSYSGYNADIYLPSRSAIESAFGYFETGKSVGDTSFIRIYLLCTRWSNGYDRVKSSSTTPIIDRTGDTISYVELNKGDVCSFTYHNGAWYLSYANW